MWPHNRSDLRLRVSNQLQTTSSISTQPPFRAVVCRFSRIAYWVFLGGLLHHFDVNCNPRREIEVREGLDHLWRRVHDINEALMDAHFELFASVLVDER